MNENTTQCRRHNGFGFDGCCSYCANKFRRLWQRMDRIYRNRPKYAKENV